MAALTFAQLNFFRAVMEEGSIVGASRRMNCVASNVTTRLKELEQILGQPLFVREKGRLTVTPAGRLLYKEALPVISGMNRLSGLFDEETLTA